jgi:ketosteroid isomerase-like protein
MSNSDLVRRYFSAYENKDRKAVESLLTNDFVFTSLYDYRIDRETYFKRCWPAAPGTRSSSPSKEAR